MPFSHDWRRLQCPLIVLCIVSIVWLWPADAAGQIALVHVTSCGPGSFPMACTIPSTGSGNLLVVGWTGGTVPSLLRSISDNTGNVYAEATGARSADWSADVSADVWYAADSLPGTTSVTLTPRPNGSQGAAVIWEFSGVSTTSPLAQSALLKNQPSTTTPVGAAVATTSANELIVSIAAGAQSITGIHQGNSFTEDSSVRSTGWAHLVAASTGAYSAEWNESSSGQYCSSTVAFTAAAAAGLTYLLTASPTSLAFGDVEIGSCNTLTDTLASTGTGPVTMSAVNVTGAGFTASGPTLPFTLAAGYSTPLNATYCPTSGAAIVGSVTVVSNASNSPAVVSLSGTGLHNVTFSWTESTSSGVTEYDVYRSTNGSPYSQIGSVDSTGAQTYSYTDSPVPGGSTCDYEVTAVNSSGQSTPVPLAGGPVTIPSP
jgi:hypothetical protein